MTWKLNPKIPTRGAAAVTHDFLMWKLCQFLTLTSSASFGSFWISSLWKSCNGSTGKPNPLLSGHFRGSSLFGSKHRCWSIFKQASISASAPLVMFCTCIWPSSARDKKWKVKKRESATKVFCCLLCESDLCEEHWNQAAQAGRAVTSRLVCKTATAHWFGDRGLCEPRGRSWRWSRSPNKHVHRTCTAPVAKEIFTLWNWLTYLCTAEPGLKRSSAQRGLDWQFGAEWQKAPCVTRRPEVWSNNQTSMTSSVEF